MPRFLPLLALLLLPLYACNTGGQLDDDDDATDDDDSASAEPIDTSLVVDQTYCSDWDTATIVEPPDIGMLLGLAGVSLADYPILISPTAIDEGAGTINMRGATATPSSCTQDVSVPSFDPTATTPGTFTNPHFDVGPTTMTLNLQGIGALAFENTLISGDFTADGQAVVDGTLSGMMDVSTLPGACFVLTCVPCPSNSANDCAAFLAENIVFNNNGLGPLTAVP